MQKRRAYSQFLDVSELATLGERPFHAIKLPDMNLLQQERFRRAGASPYIPVSASAGPT
jgi:hypothetical protein